MLIWYIPSLWLSICKCFPVKNIPSYVNVHLQQDSCYMSSQSVSHSVIQSVKTDISFPMKSYFICYVYFTVQLKLLYSHIQFNWNFTFSTFDLWNILRAVLSIWANQSMLKKLKKTVNSNICFLAGLKKIQFKIYWA